MDTAKIVKELQRRFSAPLPEFHKRRVIFWIDESGEFADKLDEIAVEGVKLVKLTRSNNFYVKKLLAADDPDGNYLIYRPFAYASAEENWLLDAELYGEEFRADLISMWLKEMDIPQSVEMRNCVGRYRKFFGVQKYRDKVKALAAAYTASGRLKSVHLWKAVMAVLAGVNEASPNAVIKAVLLAGRREDSNPVYKKFVSCGIDEAFWMMAEQGTGYRREGKGADLSGLAAHLLVTAASRTLRGEFLGRLPFSGEHQGYCCDFVFEWMHGRDAEELKKIAAETEEELGLPKRFMKLQIADLLDTEIFPCLDEIILVKLMEEIRDHIIDVGKITETVGKRRTCAWYEDVRPYYEAVLLTAEMQNFYQKHASGFHIVEPAKVWEKYTSEYYVMDTFYREFHRIYSEIEKEFHDTLSDLSKDVNERVEGLYTNWFLEELGRNWSDACADDLRERGIIPGVPQQTDFYRDHVKNAGSRVYVIISDALRFETAVSLAERLQLEHQAKVKLSSMQGVFPTVTHFGMAALLPHNNKLSAAVRNGAAEQKLAVLADGMPTDAPNRDKVLKAAEPASIALKYEDFINWKREERAERVRGMKVVYIYHNAIDAAGHSENAVFSACDAAIAELNNLVRIIVGSLSGTKILITADHGFLYTLRPLTEENKVEQTADNAQNAEIGRRYAILKRSARPQYLLPVKFLGGTTEYDGFAPRENIRIKKKGGGLNFVHGGISLQEMAVPLIEFRYLRSESKEYRDNREKYDTRPVRIKLLSEDRKITNKIFYLDFYQDEAVGGNREAAVYKLYFTDSGGRLVSDVQKIIADKRGENNRERTFRVCFNLKSLKYSSAEIYRLIITDEDDVPVHDGIEFQIDIAFAVDEFDFFG